MAEPTGFGGKVTGQLSQLTWQKWRIAVGVLVVAISGLFGGFDTAPETPTAVNTAIDAGPWKVTVTGARLVGELPPMHLSDEKNLWVVVLATVEITMDRTSTDLGETVQLAPTPGIKGNVSKTDAHVPFQPTRGVVLVRDATKIGQLNPGMPEKLAFFWELESGAPIPAEVKVYIGFRKFRKDGLSDQMAWKDASERNQSVVVPVVDRREATAASS